jgi:hypothetical protein
MPFSLASARLAGFAFAHATWSICDNNEDLVPLALVQMGGEKKLHRFAMENFHAQADRVLETFQDNPDVDGWSLIQQAKLNNDDVFVIRFGAHATEAVLMSHQFQRHISSGEVKFRMPGRLSVHTQHPAASPEQMNALIAAFWEGFKEHEKAVEQAPTWFKP